MNHRGIEDKAAYIKETRLLLGMSQPQLAQAMGVTIQSVSFWENKKREPSQLAIEWCIGARQCWEYAEKIGLQQERGQWLLHGGLQALVRLCVEARTS